MTSQNETRLQIRVQPGASRNEIVDFNGEVLRVRIAAPPVRDKANRELIVFLSKTLDVDKSSICIIKGHSSRNKVVSVAGLSQDEIIKRLAGR